MKVRRQRKMGAAAQLQTADAPRAVEEAAAEAPAVDPPRHRPGETIDEKIRATVAKMVEADGLYPTARKLSTSRTGLSSYLAGTARRGTVVVIEAVYHHVFVEVPERLARRAPAAE